MNDRDAFDVMRLKALSLVREAGRALDATGTSDGKMSPHVALERIGKIRKLARQMQILAEWSDTQ